MKTRTRHRRKEINREPSGTVASPQSCAPLRIQGAYEPLGCCRLVYLPDADGSCLLVAVALLDRIGARRRRAVADAASMDRPGLLRGGLLYVRVVVQPDEFRFRGRRVVEGSSPLHS